ncbi:group-specific protein [Mechercharimyces sp. CAU 1602]|uniref:group-specific protein n=1 Tax=Mechercharimyces sp. CAU 1602 TaxID=2973933 RepID=UPI002163273D|nr:group-specific protein [Mechercharimyces sp. CAU 1602]MCS1350527.1 group-specific protein [Mechercharimyces sp. CAU 1602]
MFMYHQVPDDLQGEYLYPLNELASVYPHISEQKKKKYEDHPGRISLPQRKVPYLNCLWNDVIHCSPLHPAYLYRALSALGVEPASRLFFRIPYQQVAKLPVVCYHYSPTHWKGVGSEVSAEDCSIMTIEHYKELTFLPEETIKYFEQSLHLKRPFGLFHFIPHMLVKGKIFVGDCSRVDWSE